LRNNKVLAMFETAFDKGVSLLFREGGKYAAVDTNTPAGWPLCKFLWFVALFGVAFGKEQYSNPEIGASHPSILGAFGK